MLLLPELQEVNDLPCDTGSVSPHTPPFGGREGFEGGEIEGGEFGVGFEVGARLASCGEREVSLDKGRETDAPPPRIARSERPPLRHRFRESSHTALR
jgi:hypothetical protein